LTILPGRRRTVPREELRELVQNGEVSLFRIGDRFRAIPRGFRTPTNGEEFRPSDFDRWFDALLTHRADSAYSPYVVQGNRVFLASVDEQGNSILLPDPEPHLRVVCDRDDRSKVVVAWTPRGRSVWGRVRRSLKLSAAQASFEGSGGSG
jgi:hypothetical protein